MIDIILASIGIILVVVAAFTLRDIIKYLKSFLQEDTDKEYREYKDLINQILSLTDRQLLEFIALTQYHADYGPPATHPEDIIEMIKSRK